MGSPSHTRMLAAGGRASIGDHTQAHFGKARTLRRRPGIAREKRTCEALSPQIVPAVLLTVFTATMIGYALAHAIERPMVTVILTQLFIFLAFGYAPINFPADQMPNWLVQLNRGLPFLPMAEVVRDGLTHGLATRVGESYMVLTGWALAAAALAIYALGRRR